MFLIRKNKLIMLLLSILLVVSVIPQAAFADAIEPTVHDDTTVRVYLTMSYDSEFLRAGNDEDFTKRSGKVLARVPIDVSYTDLKKYGLEEYYRYEAWPFEQGGEYKNTTIVVQPTVLMLYLRATSLYYLEREITTEDIGLVAHNTKSATLTLSGGATHTYFTRFWGHGENLMYYVNHEFPLQSATGFEGGPLGSTADYILLEDGDEIDLGMFTNMSFNQFGAFAYFDTTFIQNVPDQDISLSLLSTATYAGSTAGMPLAGETIRVSSDYGETWKETDISTSDDGSFRISFDEPGVYYISAGPDFVTNMKYGMACIAPPIAVAEIKPEQVTSGKTFNPTEGKVTCRWEGQGSNVKYKVDYRNTGDSAWKTTEVTEPEITVDDVDPSKCEFRITAIMMSDYVAYGENSKKISAKASAIFRHSGYVPPEEDPDEQAARELADAKQTAVKDLQNYKSPDLYREAEQASLASIIESGTAAINSAATVEAVQTAYDNAVSSINALKTKAQYEAEEQDPGEDPEDPAAKVLAETKATAKAELAAYLEAKDPALYRDEQKAELTRAGEQGSTAIDAAQTVDAVAQALADAKAALDAVKTDAQMTEEEKAEEEQKQKEEAARKLKEAKDNAKMELDLYMAPSEYREAEKALLIQILTEGKAAIDAAETEDAVKALLTEHKGRIDQLKTDAEYTAEEEAARQEEERKKKEQEEEQRAAEEKRKAEILAAKIKAAKTAKPKVTAKALKKHKAKISWKKVTLSYSAAGENGKIAVSGYEVYRSTKKKSGYRKIKKLAGAGRIKLTDKKLKKGKKYFYKVRTYTKINGETYLGKWSAVKKIRGR